MKKNLQINSYGFPKDQGLYSRQNEHDSCGVGFLANLMGQKSHDIIEQSVEVLKNLLHRGAVGADMNTGDGAGLLFQIPDRFFRKVCGDLGITLPKPGEYGVGMIFMPKSESSREVYARLLEDISKKEGLVSLGWRDVPTSDEELGVAARAGQPVIMQYFVDGKGLMGDQLERKLYIIRKQVERLAADLIEPEEIFYIASFSCRTVVYKGLLLGTQLRRFYPDLADPEIESAIVVIHQRYSTNTFPSWQLAQPFRYLAHNGEINTIRGNLNWMKCREDHFKSNLFGDDIKKIIPVIEEGMSDSACLDMALELLVSSGRSLHHAASMLIPQGWGDKYPMGPDLRGFYEYHAGLMEPWDGPASVAFSDGRHVGAVMDRNGLRPARYTVTKSGLIVFASEAGVLDIPANEVSEKGALRPGQMLLVDLTDNRLKRDMEIKMQLARQQPYRRWVTENKIAVRGFFNSVASVEPDEKKILTNQRLFGYTREDLEVILDSMACTGHEPVGSMGSDQPLAVLSDQPQLLFWYFKQLFAQVTNPAIDPMREELVMSLMTFLGAPNNILKERPQYSRLVKLYHPILANEDLERIANLNLDDFPCKKITIGFPVSGGGDKLGSALDALCLEAESIVTSGVRIVILSDRDMPEGMVPIPSLLAVSAVNRHLIRKNLRTNAGLILETGEAREVMHMALLLGYGASAVNPWLAFESIAQMVQKGQLSQGIGNQEAVESYIKALCKGLLKIMSKMGISTLRSYRGAQVFEAIGLSSELVETYFEGTMSRIEGVGLQEIAAEANLRYKAAMDAVKKGSGMLPSGGQYKSRHDGARHLWSPEAISTLQQATRTNNKKRYREFASLINNQEKSLYTLRGLFRFKKTEPIPLDDVEPVDSIVKRFVTGAMSFGSISRQAHETLAIAMNRIGGMSNSGEGGEDPQRYELLPNGDNRSSAVKQVASGRFGVTAQYLASARDIQIKIAQGAKPGEGGQLPGYKVNEEIARVRYSTPGVTLISPPPHHDIYSIEDIAQLIYDLKNANRDARVSVKLVSETGVGTIAAGVAKARADMILISGYDGGTGASPLSSIKHAGMPWELGLSETQQTLVLNGLRSRVRLQADGQMKTGRDVVIAALLGAEEFGFATAALVVCGCVMMRKCHENMCPVGIATQLSELTKRFSGKPEYVVNYFKMVAEEVREYMAELGIKNMDEMVGRSDLLEMKDAIQFWKAKNLDFSKVFYRPSAPESEMRNTIKQKHELENALDIELLPQVEQAIKTCNKLELEAPIRNVHRTVGTIISSEIAKLYGGAGLPDDTIILRFKGAAGQSFGAFCSRGMTLVLEGEANDYLGKGLSGAKIILKPPRDAGYNPCLNIIAGNVLLYGATTGEVYINGRAGERFGIRNSGAVAVVEGVGDHGCEYMTGGRVAILGPTGVNFGAGMSGGIAYVYDETGKFDINCNLEMIDLDPLTEKADIEELRNMLERHIEYTQSNRAKFILGNFDDCLPHFIKVFPMEYKRVLGKMSREDEEMEREEVRNV